MIMPWLGFLAGGVPPTAEKLMFFPNFFPSNHRPWKSGKLEKWSALFTPVLPRVLSMGSSMFIGCSSATSASSVLVHLHQDIVIPTASTCRCHDHSHNHYRSQRH
jgi:hypothetical protein